MKEKLLILDANSILHRAYHALPHLTTKKGEPVNAVYGFLLILFKSIKEFQPKYICACFDFPAKTFRHNELKEYKATRPPTPNDLVFQIRLIKKILEVLKIPIFEKEGFEADDLIGTISSMVNKNENKNIEIIILSGDSDVLQLVEKQTKVYLLKKGVSKTDFYDEEIVKKRYDGLNPSQLADFKALRGDPSDNVSGVKGIGEKTAIKLIKKYKTLENLYREIEKDEIEKKVKEQLLLFKEKVFLYRKILKIKKEIPGFEIDLKKCLFGNYQKEEVEELFKKLEFSSLLKKISLLANKKENLRLL